MHMSIMLIKHSKNLNPLLNLLISSISARSVPKILSIKGEFTFLLLKFLIIGLCNSSANSLLEIFLIPLPGDFLSKIYKLLK